MCNVHYRIFAEILTSRIESVIPYIVGEQQTCGIRGRTIQRNTHIARTVLDYYDGDISNNRVAIVQLDLEKAFDRVRHSFI